MGSVIRSKGFCWLASRNERMGIWSQAGGSFSQSNGGLWWACTPKDEWPEDPADLVYIENEFQGEYGDRRQELVFIGCQMDETYLRSELLKCLLTDEEMKNVPIEKWNVAFTDPFPDWSIVPLPAKPS